MCPTGFLLEITALWRSNRRYISARCPNIGSWLLFSGLGMAVAGYPLLMAFDPLAILSGFLSTWQWKNLDWPAFIPALPFLGLVVFNIIWPNLWCRRLCPLGVAQHFLGMPLRRLGKHHDGESALSADIATEEEWRGQISRPGVNRRFFLMTLAGGVAGSLLMPKKQVASVAFVRPPGAVNENMFTGLCARCGNCVNVCPESIIFPDFGSSGVCGLFTPVLRFDRGYCNEWCRKCTDSCPTTAIRRISLEQKRRTAVGKARINKSICLAWSGRQHCMVCQEFCPYQAIDIVDDRGINCPEVDESLCRGCGACQSQCPAIPERAIVVRGMADQELIEPMSRPE